MAARVWNWPFCAQLAKLMHGRISPKSTISVGSTFTLAIPLVYLKEQASSMSSSLVMPGSRATSKLGISKPNSIVTYDEHASTRPPARDQSQQKCLSTQVEMDQ